MLCSLLTACCPATLGLGTCSAVGLLCSGKQKIWPAVAPATCQQPNNLRQKNVLTACCFAGVKGYVPGHLQPYCFHASEAAASSNSLFRAAGGHFFAGTTLVAVVCVFLLRHVPAACLPHDYSNWEIDLEQATTKPKRGNHRFPRGEPLGEVNRTLRSGFLSLPLAIDFCWHYR